MKIKLTEQQINSIVKNFGDVEKDYPTLSKLAKIMSADSSDMINADSLISNLNPDTDDKFSLSVPTGGEPMHPLGHKHSISSNFGLRNGSAGSKNHKGVDIATPSGSPVYAPLDGIVIDSRDTTPNPCGGFIKLKHQDIQTKFCHLKQMNVKRGDSVKKGQIIGYSGGGKNDQYRGSSTGPHLHYEILNMGNIAMNPTNVQHNLA